MPTTCDMRDVDGVLRVPSLITFSLVTRSLLYSGTHVMYTGTVSPSRQCDLASASHVLLPMFVLFIA